MRVPPRCALSGATPGINSPLLPRSLALCRAEGIGGLCSPLCHFSPAQPCGRKRVGANTAVPGCSMHPLTTGTSHHHVLYSQSVSSASLVYYPNLGCDDEAWCCLSDTTRAPRHHSRACHLFSWFFTLLLTTLLCPFVSTLISQINNLP